MLDPALQAVAAVVQHYRDPVVIVGADETACWVCGCTDNDACVDVDDLPCFWVDEGLCSACVAVLLEEP